MEVREKEAMFTIRITSKVYEIVKYGSYLIIQDLIRPLGSLNELFMYYLRMQKWKSKQLLALAYMLYLYKSH